MQSRKTAKHEANHGQKSKKETRTNSQIRGRTRIRWWIRMTMWGRTRIRCGSG